MATAWLVCAPSAGASMLAEASEQWEQMKFSLLQQDLRERAATGLFVTATQAAGAQIQTITLRRHGHARPHPLVLDASRPWQQGSVEAVPEGEHSLEVAWWDEQGTQRLSQKAFVVGPGWMDIHLRMEKRLFSGEELTIEIQSRQPGRWGSWQRIAALIPGLVSDEGSAVLQPSDLSSFRWAGHQCSQEPDAAQAHRAVLELLHALSAWSAEPLGAEAYTLLSRCLLAHGLLASAIPILEEQHRESAQNGAFDAHVELLARRLAAEQRWTALRSLSVPAQERPWLRFYQAIAAAELADWDRAIAEFGALYRERRRLQWETYEAADALTLQAGFNWAMALQAAGQEVAHWFVLDELGQLSDVAEAALLTQERANLQLGWGLLNRDKAASARPVFHRMALHGPFSRHALLGLGWSVVLPQGAPISRPETWAEDPQPVTAGPQTAGVLLARHRAGEMPCAAVLQGTGRHDLCNVLAAMDRGLSQEKAGATAPEVARLAWETLSQRGVPDLLSLEGRVAQADLHHQAGEGRAQRHALRSAEPLLGQMKATLKQVQQMAADRDEAVFAMAPPALQMWLREAEPHGMRQLIAEVRRLRLGLRPVPGMHAQLRALEAFEQKLSHGLFAQLATQAERQAQILRRYELDLRVRLARALDPVSRPLPAAAGSG